MTGIPELSQITVCEVRNSLISADAANHDSVVEKYNHIIGQSFRLVDSSLRNYEGISARGNGKFVNFGSEILERSERVATSGSVLSLKRGIESLFEKVGFRAPYAQISMDSQSELISWNKRRREIAVLSGHDLILIFNVIESASNRPPLVIQNENQRDVTAMEWRPLRINQLAVACKKGVLLYTLDTELEWSHESAGSLSANCLKEAKAKFVLVEEHPHFWNQKVTNLKWSSDGRYLAFGFESSSVIHIWDAVCKEKFQVSAFMNGANLLRWDPKSKFLFAASNDGLFAVWEKRTGRLLTWKSTELWGPAGGRIVGAQFSPSGDSILMAFEGSFKLGVFFIDSNISALDGKICSLELNELHGIQYITGSSCGISQFAWDASGSRLAVSYYGGDNLTKGLVAVYSTQFTGSGLNASLIGFIRGGSGPLNDPVSLEFHEWCGFGALLAIRWQSGEVRTYPLVFGKQNLHSSAMGS